MEQDIRQLDEVWTADEEKLGLARNLYYREEGADPVLKLYRSYLGVEDFDYGVGYYVPTDFIAAYHAERGRVSLSVTRQKVEENTWSRMPDFVALGKTRKVALPKG